MTLAIARLQRRTLVAGAISAGLHALVFLALGWGQTVVVTPHGLTLELLRTSSTAPKSPAPSVRPQAVASQHREAPARPTVSAENKTETKTAANLETRPNAQAETAASYGRAAAEPSALSEYVAKLVGELQKNRSYPKDAINREEEGIVSIWVRVSSGGEVLEARVKDASPYESLNMAALKTVQKIGLFPKPPVEAGRSIDLTIPIRFKIERL